MRRVATESDYRNRRIEMVRSQVSARGVHDARVLEALSTVPREQFVPQSLVDAAYEDRALGIGMGQTISQPYVVAWMTEALSITNEHSILEIGTGTGYQTAILARLARAVYTVERIEALATEARVRLNRLGISNVAFRTGDGSLGWESNAPFDRIIVTAAAPAIASQLVDQLSVGGRLVIPTGSHTHQVLTTLENHRDGVVETSGIPVRFVKLIGAKGFPS